MSQSAKSQYEENFQNMEGTYHTLRLPDTPAQVVCFPFVAREVMSHPSIVFNCSAPERIQRERLIVTRTTLFNSSPEGNVNLQTHPAISQNLDPKVYGEIRLVSNQFIWKTDDGIEPQVYQLIHDQECAKIFFDSTWSWIATRNCIGSTLYDTLRVIFKQIQNSCSKLQSF